MALQRCTAFQRERNVSQGVVQSWSLEGVHHCRGNVCVWGGGGGGTGWTGLQEYLTPAPGVGR